MPKHPKNTNYKIYAASLEDSQDSLFWIFAIAKNSTSALKILDKVVPDYKLDKDYLEGPIDVGKDGVFIIDPAFCLLSTKNEITSFLESEEENGEEAVEKIEVNQEVPSSGSDSVLSGDEIVEDVDDKKTRAIVILPKDEDKKPGNTNLTEWV